MRVLFYSQGVEPATVPSLTAALEAGRPVTVEAGGTLADGLLVPTVGSNAFQIAKRYVDKCVPPRVMMRHAVSVFDRGGHQRPHS